eukprot:3611684-Ditylum_brightwellii.AAC.1
MVSRPDTPMDKLIQIVQDKIDLYTGLACTTCSQVSPVKRKNSWYLIEFAWDKSEERKLAHNKVSLFVNTREGRIEVKILPPAAALRTIGVWMVPNGGTLVQVEKLEALTKLWTDQVRSGLKIYDAWYYY